jgi:formylglycine-generating enzyme required for sulfatase activity/serine/threonine protein kinase
MGFFNRIKGVFSTGQASAVDEARRLYASNDLEGAVNCLRSALDSRQEAGKALAVIREHHDAYLEELHQRRLTGDRATLSHTPFDASNYSVIEGILSSIDKGLKEGVYSGKTRPVAEGLYKEYQVRFQELREKAQKEKHQEIIGRLRGMDPEDNADEFVTLVEELRSIGGRLPQAIHSDYQEAQERSYVLPDNIQEFDNYVIERKLGSGGFASVFLASPKGVSFQAAIKIFSPQPTLVRESGLSLTELKERFRREAGIMLRLSTGRVPGIVNARHTETWRGKPYLTMDYYPKSLSSLIGSDEELLQTGRGGYLNYDKALPIISRVLTSIHGLHNRTEPIIHRDLKPANILLDKDNRPYIGDFGLAREASRADLLSKAFETVTGTNLATQYYGAPEQRGGFKETDQRADVFSLGVIIYRILTGRLIGFHDLEPIELYVEGLGKDTAAKIDDLLNKATRIEVDQRLSDISTLLEIFSTEQTTVEVGQAPLSGPTPEDQFLAALELAYSFAPDGNLPENVRATLITKSQEIGLDSDETELLDKDFRSRLGLSEDKSDRVISATSGAALKTGEEKGIGTLVITSEPEMATVSVDGIERGTTPLTIDRVGAGKRTIRLKMNGFFPVSRIERIDPEKETKIHVILEHQTGSINVSAKTFSDAYPARFYLDGKLMGRPPLTVGDVTAGTHTYRFEADNHQEISGEIVVNLDEEVKLDESLTPLPGRVSLESIPPGATIWVNGKRSKARTDVKAKITPGKHAITLKLDSYVDATREIEVLPGSVLEEKFQLIKNQGRINVASIPEGASIWIDGKDTGKKTDHLMEVVAGEHELTLKLDGYKDVQKKVHLDPEGFTEVEFRLEKGVTIVAPEPTLGDPNTFIDPVTGMELVYVPGGKFMMGDVFGDSDEYNNQKPVHQVTLDGFYMGKYPVTQGQWKKVMRNNPSNLKITDEHPVENVSWDDTQEFIEKLAAMNNGKYEFRLPTEAEWEYAARSGGKKEKYAGGNDVDAVAWYGENSEWRTHPVGKKLPNGLGLYDMSGNVQEWCYDWHHFYPSGPVSNPKGPPRDSNWSMPFRVSRGGHWFDDASHCRSTYRFQWDQGGKLGNLGFRLARTP